MFGVGRDQILGLVRHIITFVGGILVARGQIDIGQVETIVGIITTVAGFLFSMMAPEKVVTPEKIIAALEPAKAAAVADILKQPEPPKVLPQMETTGPAPVAPEGQVREQDRVATMPRPSNPLRP